MSCDCGLREMFTDNVSRRDAKKYRRRGLDPRARKLIRALEGAMELRGRTSLEIGIGAGAFTVELLRHGVVRATGVDIVPNQLAQAQQLAQEAGVARRLQLQEGDFTEISADVGSADIVVLDRVVCCYPEWRPLLTEAAAHAQGALVMAYPREAWYTRIWVNAANAGMRILRRAFRMHLHQPREMHAMLRGAGFTPKVIGYRGGWELLIATR